MPRAYYNEVEPYAAAWLRNLIAAGLIPDGDVDERSIVDVRASDLDGYTQVHLFAGLGGWCRALRLAGFPDDRPVWTGSPPCQPFSVAGRKGGFDDPRHLWPSFAALLAERRPATVFIEQVASALAWLAVVRRDLESMGYAVAAVPIEAASAGADHLRDRLWTVADRYHAERGAIGPLGDDPRGQATERDEGDRDPTKCRPGDLDGGDRYGHGVLAYGPRERLEKPVGEPCPPGQKQSSVAGGHIRPMDDAPGDGWGEGFTSTDLRERGFAAPVASLDGRQYLQCPDGRWRRLPPSGVRWLGYGIPCRVAKLRALGNAIDPRPAAQFIGAWLDLDQDRRRTGDPSPCLSGF